jgi:hypothetical protein
MSQAMIFRALLRSLWKTPMRILSGKKISPLENHATLVALPADP